MTPKNLPFDDSLRSFVSSKMMFPFDCKEYVEYRGVVSFAKKNTNSRIFEAFVISSMYRMKRRGPNINPCSTPQIIF